MRRAWTLGVCLAGAVAVVGIAVGVTYLSVDARSLPTALGRIAGSSDRRTVRGFFAAMIGGLALLVAILLNAFRPGGGLAANAATGDAPSAAADAPASELDAPSTTGDTPAADEHAPSATGDTPAAKEHAPSAPGDAPVVTGDAANAPADDQPAGAGRQYIGGMDDEIETEPLMGREARHREERRAVEEAGGGESEGFELAEQELIEHASHGDEHSPSRIMQDAVGPDEELVESVDGEADEARLPD
jgi:hypothetical protein